MFKIKTAFSVTNLAQNSLELQKKVEGYHPGEESPKTHSLNLLLIRSSL